MEENDPITFCVSIMAMIIMAIPIRMICLQTDAVTANGKKQQLYGKHRSNGDSIHHCCAGLYLVQAWLHGRPIRPEVIVNSYRHNMSGIDFVVGNG